MTIADIYFQDKHIEKFLLTLQALLTLANSPLQLLKHYGKLISSLVLSKFYLWYFKAIFSFLTKTPESQENGRHIYDTACQIRNYFVEAIPICDSTIWLRPFRKLLEHAAIDWDDFVEDCTVAGDSEIKVLLAHIMQHV